MRRGQIPVALNAKIVTDKGPIRPIYKEFLENEKVKDNNPIEERAKNRTVYRRMILVLIKRCITSLIIRKIQVKITLRFHFYPLDQQKYQNWIVHSAGAAMGKQALCIGTRNDAIRYIW